MPCEQPVNKSNSPAISILSAIWILKLFTEKSHGGSACEQVGLTKSFQSEVWNRLRQEFRVILDKDHGVGSWDWH